MLRLTSDGPALPILAEAADDEVDLRARQLLRPPIARGERAHVAPDDVLARQAEQEGVRNDADAALSCTHEMA
jgi:hypothetical protein